MWLMSVVWVNVEVGIYYLNDEWRFLFIGIIIKNYFINVLNYWCIL